MPETMKLKDALKLPQIENLLDSEVANDFLTIKQIEVVADKLNDEYLKTMVRDCTREIRTMLLNKEVAI